MKKKFSIILSCFALMLLCLFFVGDNNVFAANLDYDLNNIYWRENYYGDVYRSVKTIITDDGMGNNPYDRVELKYLLGTEENQSYFRYNYGYIVLKIEMSVYEENDGYQYIFIFDNYTDEEALLGGKFEHGKGKCNKTSADYTFYIGFQYSKMANDSFVIRYSASGNGKDNWINYNLKVSYGFSKSWSSTGIVYKSTLNSSFVTLPVCKK